MFSEVFCATSRSAASFSFSRSSSTKLTILVAIIFNARYSSPISLRLRIGSERISFSCSSLLACGTSQNRLIDYDIRMIGDTIILCTDGLYGEIGDEGILKVCGSSITMHQMAKSLIDAANRAGGRDNITAVCIRIQ